MAEPNTTKWGEPGSRIPGSKYVRGYCPACGDPIRVVPGGKPVRCQDCQKIHTAECRRNAAKGVRDD